MTRIATLHAARPEGEMGMFFYRLLLICWPMLWLGASAPAAEPAHGLEKNYLLRTWRTGEGLPQNSVFALAQTAEGYLWAGTEGGLARFDGVRFTNYGLADGLRGGRITSLVEDGQGGLWIGTMGGGLGRLHGGRFTMLTTADGLAHRDVMALARAEPGGLWVGTKRGLQHWGPGGFKKVGAAEGLISEVIALEVDHEQGLWVTVEEKGLFYCKGHSPLPVYKSRR